MAIVRTPYRWLPRTVGSNLVHWAYDIRNGVSNLWRFKSVVWWYRGWDWTGLVGLILVAAEDMADCQKHSLHLHADRHERRLRVIAALCKRLKEDEYFSNAGYGEDGEGWQDKPEHERTQIAKHAGKMGYQDAAYLGKMFKYLQEWWS